MKLKEIKPGMVIRCKTQEEADKLCDTVGAPSRWKEYWDRYKDDACYQILSDGIYSYGESISYGIKNITEFSEIIMPELTAEEVLQWLDEHTDEDFIDVFGRTYHSFSGLFADYNPEQIVSEIAQWKSDHEKKEPEIETEWFWQGRIFKVEKDGGYYRIKDGNGFYDTGCEYQESAEEYMNDILKEYCKTHDGEFIAVVEHVCRVKVME